MKYLTLFVVVSILLLPPIARAHSVLGASDPAQNAILTDAPETITPRFQKGLRLTAIRLDGSKLKLPKQRGFGREIVVDLPQMTPGAYEVEWRGLSEDGHSVKGTIGFVVNRR